MARARNIKPGFFKNEVLGVADPLYSLLFEGLWVLADREGRLEDRPLRIKAEVFPYREGINVDTMLNWLVANGFIQRYTEQGKKCILVLEFVKHQNPHKNEAESELPAPSIGCAKPEEIGTTTEIIGSAPADSLSSDSLIPSTLIPEGETTPRKRVASFPVPDWINREHWDAWHSCKKRKNATDAQKQMAVDKLDAWRREGVDHAAALENAAIGGWQGLFKPDERGHIQATGETAYQRSMRERMQEAAPDIARRSPTAPQQDATDFFRTVDTTSRVVDIKAIEVTQ